LEPHETTVANADLWGKYFERQWAWLAPVAGPDAAQVAAASGARIANLLTLIAAGPIAWLYASNAAKGRPVMRTVDRTGPHAQLDEDAAA